MQKTAKEIIIQAEKLAQCQNSKAFDFAFKVSLLNSVYTSLYNDLTGYSNQFIKYFDFRGTVDLPSDCYKVLDVFSGSIDNPYHIGQSSQNNFIPGTYYIENNTIRVVDGLEKEFHCKYSTMPITLTAPDINEKLDIPSDSEILFMDDDGFYFSSDGVNYHYVFDDVSYSEYSGTVPTPSNLFNNYPLTFDSVEQQVIWNGTDITENFAAFDANTGEELHISNIVFDNTHIAITYDNNDVYVMLSDLSKYQLNADLYRGRYFKGEALAICGDDSTGKGVIVKSNDKFYLCSIVPDTVVEYPENVFFDVLEDRYGIQIQSLCGLNNEALQTKLQNDESSFYNSLQRSQQGLRIKNENNSYRNRFW